MSRQPLFRSNTVPYHVVNQVNNREWFPLGMHHVWRIFADKCYEISVLHGARVHALVLMSNHFHMVLSTPKSDLGDIMSYYAGSVTRSFNWKSERIGHLFIGRYKWTILNSPIYYAHTLKYVYRNPVRAGICPLVEDYRFSTLQGLLGKCHLPFPLWDPRENFDGRNYIPEQSDEFLNWLNTPVRSEHCESIKKALRHKVFSLPKEGWKRSDSILETTLT